ncbi:MAG TPA: hypothetical protein VK446_13980 [Methylocystis sp.]|nr:hypothetical protein [Methylocystis sp.]
MTKILFQLLVISGSAYIAALRGLCEYEYLKLRVARIPAYVPAENEAGRDARGSRR